jgi:hypothetical protein
MPISGVTGAIGPSAAGVAEPLCPAAQAPVATATLMTAHEDPIKDFMPRVADWPTSAAKGYSNLHWPVPSKRDPVKKIWLGKRRSAQSLPSIDVKSLNQPSNRSRANV